MVAKAVRDRPCPAAAPRIVRRGDDVTASGPGAGADPGAAPDEPPFTPAHTRRLAWSTAIFSFATGISRVLGLIREVVAKNYFGVEGKVNAFQIAFLVPNTVRALVADTAVSSAFVPVFSDLLEKGERKRAWRVASSLLWLMLLGLGALTALFILVAPLVMPRLYPQDHDLVARPLAAAVPDRRAARRLGDHRRDPQQLRRVLDPGARARRVEPRDHPRPRPRRPARRHDRRQALRLRRRDPGRHRDPGAASGALAAGARRPARARDRLARPRGTARAAS